MQRARRDLRAALNRGAAISTLICALLGLVNLVLLGDRFPQRPIAVLLLGFLGLSGWALRQAFARGDDLRPVRAIAALSIAMDVAYPLLGPTRHTMQYSPLTHVMVIGAVCCAIGFGAGAGVIASLLAGFSTYLIRAEQTTVYQGACEGVLFVVTGLAGATAVILIRRANDKVAVATSDLWELQALAAQGQQRERERGRFDAIVHDLVLGSLLVAGRGQNGEAAQRMAAEAVESYQAVDPVAGDDRQPWARRITETATQLGLHVDLRVSGTPADTWLTEALLTATVEALSNVARHSGQHEASVTAVFTPRLSRVLINDHGVGFDPGLSSGRRAGVATSIRARMRAVGGTAEIDSEPGRGTLVVLTGRHQTTTAAVPVSRWSRQNFLPMVLLAIIAVVVHSAIGLTYVTGMASVPLITQLAPFLLLATLIWSWWAPFAPRRWMSSSATVVVLAALLSANVIRPGADDWRLWFVGAMDGVVAVIAFRYTGRGAVLTALAIPSVMALVFLVENGQVPVAPITNSSAQLLVCALLGTLLRRGMTQAAQSLNRVAADAHRLRVDELSRLARAEEVRVRSSELGEACLPMLRRIAAGERLDAQEQELCLRLEAAIRDLLVARPALSPAVRQAVDEARARAVRVELAVTTSTPEAGISALRELLLSVLPQVPARAFVRATCPESPRADSRSVGIMATLVVDGQNAGAPELAAIADTLGSRADLRVDLDDDVLFVEVHASSRDDPPKVLADNGDDASEDADQPARWAQLIAAEPCPSF